MAKGSIYKRRIIALALVAVAMSLIIGGTLAYFAVRTPYVENTFVMGNVKIALSETERTYTMVPGCDIDKDPVVTVKKGSSESWLFVKLDEYNSIENYIEYSVVSGTNGWTQLKDKSGDDVAGVYYRQEAAIKGKDVSHQVLVDNKLSLKDTVDKAQLDAIVESGKNPVLTVTAYAVQRSGFDTPYAAWQEVNNAD